GLRIHAGDLRQERTVVKPLKSLLASCCAAAFALCAVAGASVALAQSPPPGAPPGPGAGMPDLTTPDMFLATIRNDIPALKALLAKGANPNCRNFLSFTPLMLAAATGHEEAAKTLLASGAELDARSPYGTPLMFAAMMGQTGMAKFLLARGAGLNPTRNDRINVLMLAAGAGDPELVKLALRNRSAINARAIDGMTALMVAARNGRVEA